MSVLKKIGLILSFMLLLPIVQARAQSPGEFQLKAVFVYNVTQFVTWPEDAFVSSGASFIIGIVGNDPFGPHLEEVIKDEQANGHHIVIRHFDTVEDIRYCHLLYINIKESNLVKSAIKKMQGKHVLTVSDTDGFGSLGGMIRIYNRKGKINMQVNLEAAKAESLVVSSKLLKLSEIVKTE